MKWLTSLNQLQALGEAAILVTIIENRGSTPRNSGSKMVVTAQSSFDTIGGGHLEHKAIKLAQRLLKDNAHTPSQVHFSLGASLGQCCGGAVTLLFEPIIPRSLHICLCGAGHVANALVPILANLPVQVTWIDERPSLFPVSIPENTTACFSDDPVSEIANQPQNSFYLVMTHNHHLDQSLIEAILKRGDARYVGMIGSITKRRKFEHRLKHKGFSEETIAQFTCPIGEVKIPGKLPGEVAVSIAAEIIQHYQQRAPRKEPATLPDSINADVQLLSQVK